MDAEQVKALEALVAKVKDDPSLVYTPELVFFKDFIQSWGGKAPSVGSKPAPEPAKAPEPAPVEEEEEEEEEPEEPEPPEEEDPMKLPEDTEPFPELGPEGEKELTDEQMDAQGAAKQAAVEAMEDGNLQEALKKYTEAIKIGNATAMMYNKRAELLLKLKRPKACIADCTAAVGINPDSGKAYRLRGKAHRFLGNWKEAHDDLATGQKLDYDDDTVDFQKIVDDKWKKINERQTRIRIREERIAKKKKDADMKRRKAEAQKAYEEAKRAESSGGGGYPGGSPGGMGGMGGGMPGMPPGIDPAMMQGLFSDPELLAALQNPKMQAAMQEIMSNPANIAKYQSDPEVMGLFNKMMSKMGGMGGMPGGMGGMGGMPEGFGGMGGDAGASTTTSGPTFEEVPETAADEVD